jgi:glycosyltransferase involved in cell wall biosynthesis
MTKILYILAEVEDFWASRLPLAAAAKEKGAEVHLAAPGAASEEKLKQHGFIGHDLPPAQQGLSVGAALKTISAIKKLLAQIEPDIVHTITLKYSFLTGMAKPQGKVIYTIAGLGYLFSDGAKPKLLRTALAPFIKSILKAPNAHVTFQNPDDRDIMLENNFVRAEAITLIRGSGVDLQKFTPRPAVDSNPPVVLLATRLIHDKGISVFIEAAEILKKRQIPARFQVAGGTTEHNPLAISKDQMERMVANKPVEWLGKVSDMPALYAGATLVVYPSWYREGIPRVLLEACAMGKAAVTTDHPGCREAVANNDNGILVPVKNAQATADAVEALLKDPARRKKMESAARARAEREFGSELIVQQTLALYGL